MTVAMYPVSTPTEPDGMKVGEPQNSCEREPGSHESVRCVAA